MDTRAKIVSLDELRRRANGRAIRWVRGHFDPMLAEHARLLERRREPDSSLGVIIQKSSASLLPDRARAELVAALSAVDFVMLETDEVAAEDLDDVRITEEFSSQVRRRHRGEEA